MIIAGAGGHSLEVLDLLQDQGIDENLFFFGRKEGRGLVQQRFRVLHSLDEVAQAFQKDPEFIIGIGKPEKRFEVYQEFCRLGGKLRSIRGANSKISRSAQIEGVDIFNYCHIGGEVYIGEGSLVNTGAQVHHETKIGKFSVINPGAVLLGDCIVGEQSSIGSNATILPGIKIGDRVTIGAGAVIIRDVPDDVTMVGVPGRLV